MKKSLQCMISRLCLLAVFFVAIPSISQTNRDSISRLLKSNPVDSVKFSCYDELCWDMLQHNPDSALTYATLAIEYAKKTNSPAKIATAYSTLSTTYYYKNKINLAIENALKAYDIRKNFPDKTQATKSLNNIAVMYEANGELDKAVSILEDAGKDVKDDYMLSAIKNNLGELYKKKGKYREALDLYIDALKLKEKSSKSDNKDKAETLANISAIYKELKDLKKARFYLQKAYNLGMTTNNSYLKAQLMEQMGILCRNEKKYDEAISYYKQSLQLKKQFGSPLIISSTMLNISTLLTATKKYDEAYQYITAAIEIKRKENDLNGLCIALNNYAVIAAKLGKHQEAIASVKEAISISQQLGEKENRMNSFKTLAEVYELSHDEKSALYWLKRSMDLRDTLITAESQKQMAEMETKYQTEKKEQEIQLLNKDKDIQAKEIALKNSQRNAFIVAFILMIVLAGFVTRSLQQNKKKNKIITQQKKEVEEAKSVIEHQKEIVDEKQKEILDSIHYAKRIQDALLASESLLVENLGGSENYFVHFKPKDIVSGDFFWATEHNNKFYLAACDSTGHGVPGAFMSLLNIGFLSEAIKEKNIAAPGEIFNYVRKRLTESISQQGQKDGFDGILICIDKSNGNAITYSAAHNKPVLVSGGELSELNCDKMPVGKGERNESFLTHSIECKAGDCLYLYTDGYADQFGGPKGKKFKYKQLEDLLRSNSYASMEQQASELDKKFNTWKGQLEQVDDVLVIGIKL